MAKNTICLWYDKDAEAAARFYAATFPDSKVGAVHRAPSDFPGGKQGDELGIEFTVCGVACIGLNGGPAAFLPAVADDGHLLADHLRQTVAAEAAGTSGVPLLAV